MLMTNKEIESTVLSFINKQAFKEISERNGGRHRERQRQRVWGERGEGRKKRREERKTEEGGGWRKGKEGRREGWKNDGDSFVEE